LYKEVSTKGESVPVKIAPISDQYGFSMRQVIQNKFGNPTDTQYTLTVSAPTFSSWDQTIDDKNFATMMGVVGSVSYTLTENKTHKEILNSSVSLASSYSVVKDPYATTVAERKVKKELAEQLAEQVSLHVLASLAGVHQ
ncbi:MAG: hypothetical protein J6S61_01960, partial [Elusimicrobiaceae bacterium]|nr:hypothetical protein [Elusimicrobiaceae bacterium]